MMPIADLAELLRTLRPVLQPGTFVFCVVPDGTDTAPFAPLGTFREAEGLTVSSRNPWRRRTASRRCIELRGSR